MSDQYPEKVKRPASQYYWGDWFKDLALQTCSLPARGLWHEMNCLMHQGEPYGHLTMPNGKPMGPGQLANLCKITPALCKKLLAELDENGVYSTSEAGSIFSRRMVRDEDVRNRRANGGQAGAEHGAKGADSGSKGGRPATNKGGEITPLETPLTHPLEGFEKPPPSSSSSSSSSPSGNTPIPPSGVDLFEEFWKAYPNKTGKDAARKAFDKRKPGKQLLVDMLEALEAQKQSEQWRKQGGQFIPNPATWLNQGRWQDGDPVENSHQETFV